MIVTQLAASIAATRPCSNGVTAMKTKFANAFGLAMLSVALSFSTSFACPETSQTTASAVESTVSENGVNATALAEASAPEGQVGEVGAPVSVAGNIEAQLIGGWHGITSLWPPKASNTARSMHT